MLCVLFIVLMNEDCVCVCCYIIVHLQFLFHFIVGDIIDYVPYGKDDSN